MQFRERDASAELSWHRPEHSASGGMPAASLIPAITPDARSAGDGDDAALGIQRGLATEPLELRPRHLVAGVVAGAHEGR